MTTPFLIDTFDRIVSNGWGTPDTGDTWTIEGGATSEYSVNAGVGKHSVATIGVTDRSLVAGPADVDAQFTVSIPEIASGVAAQAGFIVREDGVNQNFYIFRVLFNTDATIIPRISKRIAGTETTLVTAGSTMSYAANQKIAVHVLIQGSHLQWKVWDAATAEPFAWTSDITDSSIVGAGRTGFRSDIPAGFAGTVPLTFSYGNVVLTKVVTSGVTAIQRAGQLLTRNPPVAPFDVIGGSGQIDCTFRFRLVDGVSGLHKRVLHPYTDPTPTLTHDITRTVKRSVSLALDVSDTAAVDVIRDRVLISMVMADGTEYSLGRYLFTGNVSALYTSGQQSSPSLMDEEFILDQPRDAAFPPPNISFANAYLLSNSVSDSTLISTPLAVNQLMSLLLKDFNIDYEIESSVFRVSNTWSFGTTSMQVLTDLALFGDYFAPWIGNDGILHFIRSFDPAKAVPTFDWDTYSHVYGDSITNEDDLLTAPNRFIVVSNAATSSASVDTSNPDPATVISGSYDVPSSAPHSIQNRGFVVPVIYQLQLDATEQASAVARSIGLASTIYQRTTVSTFPDPRHDSYDVIRWQGENWLELFWSMDLAPGGNMTHTLQRTYT